MCPRACRLREGQRGVCFVRECRKGQMVLTSYGRSTGFCIDPIEKKPLCSISCRGRRCCRSAPRAATSPANFARTGRPAVRATWSAQAEVATPKAIAAAALRNGCRSVAMTYNDPVVFFEYAVDVADACHKLDVRTVAVTAGYMMPLPRAEFYRHFDAANVDLKAFSQRFYRRAFRRRPPPRARHLGVPASKTQVWLEITTLLIPGENDSDAELDDMTRWLVANLGADVPLHFSAFHPDFRLLDHPPTPLATLQACAHHRHRQWLAPRLRRQSTRRRGGYHVLRGLRRQPHRPSGLRGHRAGRSVMKARASPAALLAWAGSLKNPGLGATVVCRSRSRRASSSTHRLLRNVRSDQMCCFLVIVE
jgi:pyruvate formate lyase activating enzyme